MAEGFPLLREAFNMVEVRKLAARLKAAHPEFPQQRFTAGIGRELDVLNFGARQELIIHNLEECLPKDFTVSAHILLRSLGPELQKTELTGFEGFITVPLTKYVARHGLEHFDLAMQCLYEMTKRFSSEEAIRPFITAYPERTFAMLRKWAKDPNPHVRRLVSEGTRPRLPLCAPLRQFKQDPAPVLALLELLKDDPVLLVRRSVANNLNDISKDNPKHVIATLRKWKAHASKERLWVINHALRTLLKHGNRDALALMGFGKPTVRQVKLRMATTNLKQGGTLAFSAWLVSGKSQKLMIDYGIHYVKANGKHALKVFKWAKRNAKADERITLSGKHSFKEMTTRAHYPGKHLLELIVNGEKIMKAHFVLC